MDDSICKDGVCLKQPDVRSLKIQDKGGRIVSPNASQLAGTRLSGLAGSPDKPVPTASPNNSSNPKGTEDDKVEKNTCLENMIKKASSNPHQRKSQKKYHRAGSDCDSSEDEPEHFHGSAPATTLTREQALKLSLRKKIEERRKH
jgi:hypothetical protein